MYLTTYGSDYLGLAVHHRGKLATLDQGIVALAGRFGHGLELIQ